MKSFKQYITEVANTYAADVNEILLGYHCLGGSWKGFEGAPAAKKQLEINRLKIGDDAYNVQDERAKTMAVDSIKWAHANGFKGRVKKVWWTARPGILSKAVGFEVDSRKNPTDTLIQFSDKKFLGLSAKSTKGKGEIGFKNPGIGTVDSALGIDLKSTVSSHNKDFADTHDLSQIAAKRKKEIRADKKLITASNAARDFLLKQVRTSLLSKLNKLSEEELRNYLMNDWMDSSAMIKPVYIKVTGHGNKAPFTSSILNPLKNDKSAAMQSQKIKLTPVGNDSIGVTAGKKKIMKIRGKFESQAMASSFKFSGDPW